jgi:AraC family transcriptional regulator
MTLATIGRASNARLPPGRLYGSSLKSRQAGGLMLTEIAYPADFSVAKHSHELSQLCFVRQGAFSEVFGRKSREVGPFTLIARPTDEMHAHRFHRAGARCFVIEIGNESLRRLREYAPVMEDSAEFQSGQLTWLMTRVYKEFHLADEASSLAIEGLTLEVLSEVSRQRVRVFEPRPPSWLERAIEFLHAHFAEPITVGTVAEVVGIHPTHLARVFRQFHRCTVGEYVRRLRIEFACREAASSEHSLTEIALAAGFYDQSHFSRTFKQLIGITPRRYRNVFRSR